MSTRKDWCKLPYALILDEQLTPADAIVYAVLNDISKEGSISTSKETVAKLTGLSQKTIQRSLRKLKENGYITFLATTSGRRIVIQLKQLTAKQPAQQKRRANEAERPLSGQISFDEEEQQTRQLQKDDEERKEREEKMIKLLSEKIKVKNPVYVKGVYDDLKAEAEARVKDKSKLFAYLFKMINTYEDKSDGFDPTLYKKFINNV